MKILVSGATGFIGQSLLDTLLNEGHQIFALVRSKNPRLNDAIQQLMLNSLSELDFVFDVFINLAGENIASQPWTKKRKQKLYESRVDLTNNVRALLRYSPKAVISMSAVGYYGVTQQGVFYENSPPASGFSHDLCAAWEKSAQAFEADGARVTIFRLGVVLGKGGALQKMRLPFLLGLGGPIAGGQQWFSWVHKEDVIRAILLAMSNEQFSGAYNLVAPQSIRQKNFAQSYAAVLKRPAILPTPKYPLTLLFGEMATLLTEGPKIVPYRLVNQGFHFIYENIDDALSDIEKKRGA